MSTKQEANEETDEIVLVKEYANQALERSHCTENTQQGTACPPSRASCIFNDDGLGRITV